MNDPVHVQQATYKKIVVIRKPATNCVLAKLAVEFTTLFIFVHPFERFPVCVDRYAARVEGKPFASVWAGNEEDAFAMITWIYFRILRADL